MRAQELKEIAVGIILHPPTVAPYAGAGIESGRIGSARFGIGLRLMRAQELKDPRGRFTTGNRLLRLMRAQELKVVADITTEALGETVAPYAGAGIENVWLRRLPHDGKLRSRRAQELKVGFYLFETAGKVAPRAGAGIEKMKKSESELTLRPVRALD